MTIAIKYMHNTDTISTSFSLPRSGVLWVHTAFSLVYLCLAVVFMVHFSLRLGKLQQDYVSTRNA